MPHISALINNLLRFDSPKFHPPHSLQKASKHNFTSWRPCFEFIGPFQTNSEGFERLFRCLAVHLSFSATNCETVYVARSLWYPDSANNMTSGPRHREVWRGNDFFWGGWIFCLNFLQPKKKICHNHITSSSEMDRFHVRFADSKKKNLGTPKQKHPFRDLLMLGTDPRIWGGFLEDQKHCIFYQPELEMSETNPLQL